MNDREINLMMPVLNGPDSICDQALSIYPDKLKSSHEPTIFSAQDIRPYMENRLQKINKELEHWAYHRCLEDIDQASKEYINKRENTKHFGDYELDRIFYGYRLLSNQNIEWVNKTND